MSEDNQIRTQDIEGIRIERERKYLIQNETIFTLIYENFPDEIIINIPAEPNDIVDENMLDLLHEIFPKKMTDAQGNIILNVYMDDNDNKYIRKHRPNYYFDTAEDDLHKNHVSLNLRQRENDWVVTVKLRTKNMVKKGFLEGIFERIEFTSVISNELIEHASGNGSVNIHDIINQTESLKETFNLRIKPLIKDKPLKISNEFMVDSVRALYFLGRTKNMFQLSVDKISIGEVNRNLFEFELEITFGLLESWLDTVSMRVFDFLCTTINNAIRDKVTPLLSDQDRQAILNEITLMSKAEREKNISRPQLFYSSLEGDIHSFRMVGQSIARDFHSIFIKDLLPIIILPYWITIPKTYGDVNPPVLNAEDDFSFLSVSKSKKDPKKYSNTEIKRYRENLWLLTVEKFEDLLSQAEIKPELIMEKKLYAKIMSYKLTQNSYLFIFLFPQQSGEHMQLLLKANSILKRLFDLAAEEIGDRDIFQKVEVDSAVLPEDYGFVNENLSLLPLEELKFHTVHKGNLDRFYEFWEIRLKICEIKLQKLMKNRMVLRKKGDREPVMLISAHDRIDKSLLYTNLLSTETPILIKPLKGIE